MVLVTLQFLQAGSNDQAKYNLALINAVKDNNINGVKEALTNGANMLEAIDPKKESLALHLAAHDGHLEIVKFLVDESLKKDPSGESLKKMLNQQNRSRSAPLMSSIKNKHPEVTEYLLQDPRTLDRININLSNEDGFTALIYAAQSNNIALVKELLQKFPTLDIAMYDKGVDKNPQKDALAYAVENNNPEMVVELLNYKDKFGRENMPDAYKIAKEKGYSTIMGTLKTSCPQCE